MTFDRQAFDGLTQVVARAWSAGTRDLRATRFVYLEPPCGAPDHVHDMASGVRRGTASSCSCNRGPGDWTSRETNTMTNCHDATFISDSRFEYLERKA